MSVLENAVHTADGNKPFGELTLDDVRARAAELRAATGWGPMARVGPVARAWADLAAHMTSASAATVADLDPEVVDKLAGPLWITGPPV